MTFKVLRAGLQSTLQGAPRQGYRHSGVPAAGAADAYSQALANRLVRKSSTETVIESTLNGIAVEVLEPLNFSVTGANAEITLNGQTVERHRTVSALPGDVIDIGYALNGCRSYIAVSGQINADKFLGASSTYLPGGFGGYSGRALRNGDIVKCDEGCSVETLETPRDFQPVYSGSYIIQYIQKSDTRGRELDQKTFAVGQRCSRMGVQLLTDDAQTSVSQSVLESAPVYPGTIQLPPDGNPFILLCDAQTTGGYAELGQVMKTDLHQLGQLKAGDSVRFVKRSLEYAVRASRERERLLQKWLTG